MAKQSRRKQNVYPKERVSDGFGGGLRENLRVGNSEITVLDNINIDIPKAKFIVISGAPGSGKTTLLNLISGIDRPAKAK
jgi:ABC-type lipoprotein export system ATPase subunit